MFILGHAIRDGFPSLGSTALARILGGTVCGIGLFFFYNWIEAIVLTLSVIAGFYIDQKHGEGQRAAGVADFKWLLISGTTSVIATVIALAVFGYYRNAALLFAFGLFKPAYWKIAWSLPAPQTRWAAMIFGALYGLALYI